jgi:hypothetical protein
MTGVIGDEAWMTAELRAARAELDAAVARGEQAIEHARQVAASLPKTAISDEDIQQIDAAARGKDAPPELRALTRRIDSGELTWRDIVDGKAMHDPDVQAAMAANLDRLATVYRQFEEGATPDDILGRTPDAGGEEQTVLRHSSW